MKIFSTRPHLVLFLLILTLFPTLTAQDIEVVFPESFQNGWSQYIGKTVVFNQTLHICGRSRSSLVLAPKRLMTPEEVAIEGTAEFNSLVNENKSLMIYASGSGVDLTLRTGNKVDRLRATVTSANNISIVPQSLQWYGNPRPTQRPDLGNPSLVVCASNLHNYMAVFNDYAGASNEAEFKRQTNKIVKAFRTIDADIYGLVELQEGQESIQALTKALNAAYGSEQYSYVYDGDFAQSTYTKVGFIYRNTRVKPVLSLGSPYPSGIYYKRLKVQAFDDLRDYGRFVFSLNHFKAKSGSDNSTTNPIRMQNVEALNRFLETKSAQDYYKDSDVLIMGDLNAYRKEEPLRFIDGKGYIDQLDRWGRGTYSYVYSSQAGRLDHAFATPSLSSQVTGAAVFHLNSDENYTFDYPSDYQELMYRYSDHDPVLVGLRLQSDEAALDEAEEQGLRVRAEGLTILIKTLPDSPVMVTTLLGQIVYQGNSSTVSVPATGIYIVKTGKRRAKVVVR